MADRDYKARYDEAIAFSLKLQESYGKDYIVLLNMIVVASSIKETKETEEGPDAHFTAMLEMFRTACALVCSMQGWDAAKVKKDIEMTKRLLEEGFQDRKSVV